MRRVVLAIVSTVASLVLLLSFKTHSTSVATPPVASSNTTGSTSTSGSAGTSGSSTTSGSSRSSSSMTTSTTATKTVTGNSVDTRYGPVQVKVTVTNGKVTSATAVDYPVNNGRDQQINAYAIPALNQEAVQSGSASIDMISGATYTSEGYIQSLQSALDKVG